MLQWLQASECCKSKEGLVLFEKASLPFVWVNTVKTVYNDHPWGPKIVTVVDKFVVVQRFLCSLNVENETPK
jgi:hypothetical protein